MKEKAPGMDEHDEGVRQAVQHLNREALALALAMLRGEGDPPQRIAEARRLRATLKELQPQVDALPPAERPFVSQLHADAMLDLIYVLNNGRGPRSLRLEHAARELGA